MKAALCLPGAHSRQFQGQQGFTFASRRKGSRHGNPRQLHEQQGTVAFALRKCMIHLRLHLHRHKTSVPKYRSRHVECDPRLLPDATHSGILSCMPKGSNTPPPPEYLPRVRAHIMRLPCGNKGQTRTQTHPRKRPRQSKHQSFANDRHIANSTAKRRSPSRRHINRGKFEIKDTIETRKIHLKPSTDP